MWWPYTNCDVVVDDNGVGFRYSFSALKDRHTAVEVNYTDPQNGWQTSTELVEDPEAILRYGRNLLKMDAFGCTSRGQAHRAGLGDKDRTAGNADGGFHAQVTGAASHPGDIIEICDNDYAGTMTGGRILSIDAASRTLTLDREVTLPETGAATVNLINGSGKPVSVAITAHPRRTGYRSAPCLMVWRHTVYGDSPAVTASSPVPLCLHPGKHGRHLCHHGGAARTGKGSHRG
ncbi:phage tail protein [Escherichia coli]|uniref:phage tail protein n=1 Tax=Escherichia coli TaxID=562 RepID=UPI001BC8A9A3|nr:phage tail protein [Escherichia coli]